METACTSLPARADSSGNPGTGRDEPPFLSAENPIPGEIDTVVRDDFYPRDYCEEDANLPSVNHEQLDGLDSQISRPRTSHGLKGERPTSAEGGVSPHETEVSTHLCRAHVSGPGWRLPEFKVTIFGATFTCVTARSQRHHAQVVLLPSVVVSSGQVLCLAAWPVCGRW